MAKKRIVEVGLEGLLDRFEEVIETKHKGRKRWFKLLRKPQKGKHK